MKKYFEHKLVTLYLGNTFEVLKVIPESSVHLVIADPPYFLSNDGQTFVNGKIRSTNKGEWDRSMGTKNNFEFHLNWIRSLKTKLTPTGSLWISGTYHSIYMCGFALQISGYKILNDVIFFKKKITPNFSCRRFTAAHETLIWSVIDNNAKYFFDYEYTKKFFDSNDILKKENQQMHSVWMVAPVNESEKKIGSHPAQKPESLYERIIRSTSRYGETVLDPFCGSGASGVVAIKNGRSYIGIDSDEKYLELAKNKFIDYLK